MFADCFFAVHTYHLEFANTSLPTLVCRLKAALDFHLQRCGGKLVFLSNLKPQDVPQLNLKDPFLREIIEHWTDLSYKEKHLD